MKIARRQVLLTIFAVMCCAAIFIGISVLMLRSQSQPIDKSESQVPYAEAEGTPKGLLFNFDEGNSVFLYFNPDENNTMAILLPHDCDETAVANYGYTVFRRIKTDYDMLEEFIDRIGGIEIDNMRYTGVQITDMLRQSLDKQLRRNVISGIFNRIAKNSLTSENLVFIIENSNTSFSFPDGYSLLLEIQSLANNLYFVN